MSGTKITPVEELDAIIVQLSKFARDKYVKGGFNQKLFLAERITSELINNFDVQRIMIQVGYLKTKAAIFKSVYDSAADHYIVQQRKHADRMDSYDEFKKLYTISKKDFRYLKKIAVIALLNEPKKADDLQLNLKRGKSIADDFVYMDLFYSIILNDSLILELVSAFGYHHKRITKFYTDYLKMREAYKNYRLVFSESVESTRVRDQKFKELDKWMYEYFKLIKIADLS